MFSLFELYLLGSWSYPVVGGLWHWILSGKRAQVEKEIFTVANIKEVTRIYGRETVSQSPVYVGGTNVMVPVGGGSSTNWRCQYADLCDTAGKRWTNYYMTLTGPSRTWFINGLPDIPDGISHNRLPISFPMKITQWYWDAPGRWVALHQPTGLGAFEKKELLRDIMWRRRPVGFLTIPIVAGLLFAGTWGVRYYSGRQFPTLEKTGYFEDPTAFVAHGRQLAQKVRGWVSSGGA